MAAQLSLIASLRRTRCQFGCLLEETLNESDWPGSYLAGHAAGQSSSRKQAPLRPLCNQTHTNTAAAETSLPGALQHHLLRRREREGLKPLLRIQTLRGCHCCRHHCLAPSSTACCGGASGKVWNPRPTPSEKMSAEMWL